MICISSNYFIVFVFTDSIQSWFIGVFKDCGLPQVFSILFFVTPVSIVADPNRTLVKELEKNSCNIQFPYRKSEGSLMYEPTISKSDIISY